MKRTAGIILIILGILALAMGAFSYTTRHTIVDLGPIQATREETHTQSVPPIVGGIALLGGILLLTVGNGRRPTN